MKQSLQLRTSQHLALTPQLQQSIRLLQLSTLELHQELEQMLSDNPLLERLDDPLDHSVRLLADGALGAAGTAQEGAVEQTESPAAMEADSVFEAGESPDVANGDADWSFDDVARTAKAPEDDDARPQLEAHGTSLREHLLEQMRVTLRDVRDR
ncbi:MAG TPA: RNA polymerase factor sigma-54, partial [Oxalobacteraceae bacterium]|nr:RNA polymerase factor sigma-54 [Oxalobacteraceae bacterium]